MDAKDRLMHAFFTGRTARIRGDLIPYMEHEPRDQRFTTFLLPPKSQSQSESQLQSPQSPSPSHGNGLAPPNNLNASPNNSNNKYGRVSFEIHPVSNTESKCGILEEVLSSVSVLKGARKRWYVVLAEKDLYLFSKYCDARPKITINLRSSVVEWHNPPSSGTSVGVSGNGNSSRSVCSGNSTSCSVEGTSTIDTAPPPPPPPPRSTIGRLIKVSNRLKNQNWLFSCSNPKQLTAWYNKVRSF
uniref:PH domain-containing protein n=1 Tax=Chaetoceros debilis TaxID=122233 RepID=A0A6S8ZR11_9STRA